MGASAPPRSEVTVRKWIMEFDDPAVEARFRADSLSERARSARFACLSIVACFATLAAVDVAMAETRSAALGLVALRLLFALPAALMLAELGRRPGLAAGNRVIVGTEVVALSGAVVMAMLEPEVGGAEQLGMAMLAMAVLTLAPNRLVHRALLIVAMFAGWTAVDHFYRGESATEIGAQAAMFGVVVVLSYAVGAQMTRVERREWALWQGEQLLNSRLSAEIRRRERIELDLVQRANVDVLTGVANRRHFLEMVDAEFRRAQRTHAPLAIAVIDADHFKAVNDSYGHAAGDEVLRTLASVLRDGVRRIDVIGRLGGEEFAILMPGADAERACEVAERIREQVGLNRLDLDGDELTVTISVGVTEADVFVERVEDAMARADHAMYRAKEGGRNRVIVASTHPASLAD